MITLVKKNPWIVPVIGFSLLILMILIVTFNDIVQIVS